MATRDAAEIRINNVIEVNGAPCKVIATEIRGTGKSGKTVHLKLKGLKDGHYVEKSIRAEERVDEVDVQYAKLQYLYKDGDQFIFMNETTYEQYPISAAAVGKQEIFLKENSTVNAICIGETPINLEFPKSVELKVTSTPPGAKGQGDSYKEAELENGLKILVPQFVKEGDSVVIDTENFTYLERVTTKSLKSGAEVPPPREVKE